jgi:ketosteroid isomerase-like protein
VRAPFATIFRVRDGKIVAHRGYWDLAGFVAQLS